MFVLFSKRGPMNRGNWLYSAIGLAVFLAIGQAHFVAALQAAELDSFATRAWKTAYEKAVKATQLEDSKAGLPEKSLLRRDQQDIDQQINELLDEVVSALEISSLTDCRNQYAELEDKIKAAELTMAEYSELAITAPEESRIPWQRQKDYYEKKTAELKEQIQKLEQKKEEIINRLKNEYEQLGINLTREQIRFYLSSISGADIVHLSAIFHNVKQMNQKLEELLQQAPENTDIARRYYGVHVALIKSVNHAHEMMIWKIEKSYLPKVDDLAEQNAKVAQQTINLLGNASDKERSTLLATQRAQEATSKALDFYKTHLFDLKKRLYQGLQGVQRRYAIAKNAYDTIKVASSLADEIQACLKDMAFLEQMHLPDLLPIESDLLQKKFSEITAALSS